MAVDPRQDPAAAVQAITKMASENSQIVVVVVLSKAIATVKKRFLNRFLAPLQRFAEDGKVHVLNPPDSLYPPAPSREDNFVYAFLFMYVAPLSDLFMMMEPDSIILPGFCSSVKNFIASKEAEGANWLVTSFGKLGLHRKILRSKHLPRLAEVLVLFPTAPPDALFWGFVDIVGN